MASIALLLLMFFIVSTSFTTPSVMEMTVPDGERPVPLSQVVSVAIQPNGLLRCSYAEKTVEVAPEKIAGLIAEATVLMRGVPVVAVDAGNDVRYGLVVDVLDELMLAGVDIRSVRRRAEATSNLTGAAY